MKGMNTMSEKKENALVKGFKGIKSEMKKVTWPYSFSSYRWFDYICS